MNIRYDVSEPKKIDRKGKYEHLLLDFIASGHKTALLEYGNKEDALKNYNGLYCASSKYGIKVKLRGTNLYLERL